MTSNNSGLPISSDEVVAVLPVDLFVEEKFFERILDLKNAILSTNAKIGLVVFWLLN